MKVKDIMSKNIITVAPSTNIRDIYQLFVKHNVGGVPVVDKDGILLGMVTKTELLDVLIPDYFEMLTDYIFIDDFGALEEKLENIPSLDLFLAEDLMVQNVISINEEASLMKAPVVMSTNNVRRLPVINKDNKLVGIITRMDVCSALFNGGRR